MAQETNLYKIKDNFRDNAMRSLVLGKVRKYAKTKNEAIVDIGCGMGELLDLLSEAGYKNCSGLDSSNKAAGFCRKSGISIIQADISKDVPQGKKFDVATCIDVLEHIEDDFAAVKNISKMLKQNGILILNLPANPSLYGNRDRMFGHYRRYDKERVLALLSSAGFSVKELRCWNFLGLVPFIISEKLLGRALMPDTPGEERIGVLGRILLMWFAAVENRIPFPIGLNIFAVAQKK